MYKYLGLGLMGLFVLMIFPATQDTATNSALLYGAADIVFKDKTGNEMLQQRVHNQLTNEGESMIIAQTFQVGTEPTIGVASTIGSICITDNLDITSVETETATSFDADSGTSGNSGNPLTDPGGGLCVEDTTVTNTTSGLAVIGPLTFTASVSTGANLGINERIDGIGICQAETAASDNSSDCLSSPSAGSGILFAQVDVSNVTLAESETADITYTFDITSPTT